MNWWEIRDFIWNIVWSQKEITNSLPSPLPISPPHRWLDRDSLKSLRPHIKHLRMIFKSTALAFLEKIFRQRNRSEFFPKVKKVCCRPVARALLQQTTLLLSRVLFCIVCVHPSVKPWHVFTPIRPFFPFSWANSQIETEVCYWS